MAMIFAFLYRQKQLADQPNEPLKSQQVEIEKTSGQSARDQSAEELKIIEKKVEDTVKEIKENPTAANQTEAREAMIEALDVIKTKEAVPADNKALEQKAEAMKTLLDQINSKKWYNLFK